MFNRMLYVTGDPALIDDALTAMSKEGRELLMEQPGYQGVVISADRELGKLQVVSWWDTADAMMASNEALRERRLELLRPFVSTTSAEFYEAVRVHMPQVPAPGSWGRMVRFEVDPDDFDAYAEGFRHALADIDLDAGFVAAAQLYNRETGHGIVFVSYADRASLAAAASAGAARRRRSSDRVRVSTTGLEEFEIVLFDAGDQAPA